MIGLDIDVPQEDIARMSSTFDRYVAHFRGNVAKAIEKTMVQILRALSGSTKVSAKIRPIVRNPDPRAKTDARRAMFGVYKYSNRRSPRKYFSPIKGTGEYGAAIRYIGRNKVLMRVRDGWQVFTRSELESMTLGSRTLQNHKKRKIGRSGLAKDSWRWMLGQLGASNFAQYQPINNAVRVTRVSNAGAFEYAGIVAENRLSYIRKALTKEPVETVVKRAEAMMRYDMGEITRKSAKTAGLRAA